MGFILKSNFSPQFIMYKTCSLETELFLSVCHHNLSASDSPKDYPKVLYRMKSVRLVEEQMGTEAMQIASTVRAIWG